MDKTKDDNQAQENLVDGDALQRRSPIQKCFSSNSPISDDAETITMDPSDEEYTPADLGELYQNQEADPKNYWAMFTEYQSD